MQILIFGMHRSGTSMITRLINMMGAYFGPESSVGEITQDNPKGFWERPEVFKLNEFILQSKQCSWHNLQNWTFSEAHAAPEDSKVKIQKLVLSMDAFRPWVLKDPRMCLLFPAWRAYLEAPIAVIVHRSPMEIAISLQKRDGFPLEYGIALWEHYTVSMLNATQDLPRIFIRYIDMLQKPVRSCEYIYEQLVAHGARRIALPSPAEIRAFVDPALYRSKPANNEASLLSPAQKILSEMARGVRPQEGSLMVSEQSKTLIRNHPL